MTYTINYKKKLYHEVFIIYPFSTFGSYLFEKIFFKQEQHSPILKPIILTYVIHGNLINHNVSNKMNIQQTSPSEMIDKVSQPVYLLVMIVFEKGCLKVQSSHYILGGPKIGLSLLEGELNKGIIVWGWQYRRWGGEM